MFDNVGEKIKVLAKTIYIISVILFIIGGLVTAIIIGRAVENFFAGFGVFIGIAGVGFLISWVGSFFVYGYGELISDVSYARLSIKETKDEIAQLKQDINQTISDKTNTKETPEAGSKPVKKPEEKNTLHKTLEYAAKYTTDDGMKTYLSRAKKELSEEECAKIDELLKQPDTIRTEIDKFLKV